MENPVIRPVIRKVQVWIWHDGNILLLKTTAERGSFWQPVTGTVEEGESLEQAALREAREETGLAFPNEEPVPLDYEFEFEGRFGPARETVFALRFPSGADSPPEIKVDPREHDGFEWMRRESVDSVLKFSSNRKAFEKLLNYLSDERKNDD